MAVRMEKEKRAYQRQRRREGASEMIDFKGDGVGTGIAQGTESLSDWGAAGQEWFSGLPG